MVVLLRRWRRATRVAIVTVITIVVWYAFTLILREKQTRENPVRHMITVNPMNDVYDSVQKPCLLPVLNLHDPEIMKLQKPDKDVHCPGEDPWVYVHNGTLHYHAQAAVSHKGITCRYKPLIRGSDDFTSSYGDAIDISDGDMITSDFFSITCTGKDGMTYTGVLAAIAFNKNLHQENFRQKLSPKAMGLNVLIVGLDSMSRLHWQRRLPQSHAYLIEHMKAINLEGLNVMADGTPGALFPLLSEKLEHELPIATKDVPGSVSLDEFPMIWKDFKKSGYVTEFSEDFQQVGTFTYRLKGFDKQPTDHYMRPFYQMVESESNWHTKPPCVGSRVKFRMAMDYINHTYIMYPNRPKFMFTFLSEYTHDHSMLWFKHADVELSNFLKRFHDDGHMKDTLLVIMSDHGNRFSETRSTEQGKMEERLPYLSFVFPPWFDERYPDAYRNLLKNKKRLVTYRDIHRTLLNVLNFDETEGKSNVKDSAISLFNEIPAERTCKHAKIVEHWCACLAWSQVPVTDGIIPRLTQHVLNYLNEILEPKKNICSQLKLSHVKKVERYNINDKVLRFSETKAIKATGREYAVLSDNTAPVSATFQVTLVTTPGDAVFMFTLHHDIKPNTLHIQPAQISRINTYGNDSSCLTSHKHLSLYCYCKSHLRRT